MTKTPFVQAKLLNLEFLRGSMRELCLKTTTTTGCAPGVKHLLSGKLVQQRRRTAPKDCRTEPHYTLGILFPEALARRVCRGAHEDNIRRRSVCLQPPLAQESMAVTWKSVYTKPKNQPQRNSESQLESQHTEPDVSKKENF